MSNNATHGRWFPLVATNFWTTLNDNLLKVLASFICVAWASERGWDKSLVVSIAAGALVIPYIFLAPVAGKYAVIYNKRDVFSFCKLLEIGVMILASVGYIFQSTLLVIFTILLLGCLNAIYSPAKYGLIRDIGGESGVPYGSGLMEMLGFVGILGGTASAALLSDTYLEHSAAAGAYLLSDTLLLICLPLMVLAVVGWLQSLSIKVEEPPCETQYKDSMNPFRFIVDQYKSAATFKGLNWVVFGLAIFWFLAGIIQMMMIVYCEDLGMNKAQTGLVIAAAAIGIGVGSFLCGLFSRGEIRLKMVIAGGVGASVILALLYVGELAGWYQSGHGEMTTVNGIPHWVRPAETWLVALMSGGIGLAALFMAFFKVPLDSWLQVHVPGRLLGNTLAYSNVITFIFVLLASGVFSVVNITLRIEDNFIVMALILIVMTFLIFKKLFLPSKR